MAFGGKIWRNDKNIEHCTVIGANMVNVNFRGTIIFCVSLEKMFASVLAVLCHHKWPLVLMANSQVNDHIVSFQTTHP